jgi:hypothetical protein
MGSVAVMVTRTEVVPTGTLAMTLSGRSSVAPWRSAAVTGPTVIVLNGTPDEFRKSALSTIS